jgi:hypothetical protein
MAANYALAAILRDDRACGADPQDEVLRSFHPPRVGVPVGNSG